MSDWEFIFDGVFGFLSSPLWTVPVMSFIDAQSVVFEPAEENHLEWTKIHNTYRSLVESLLTSYLKDVGITEEEFMKACLSPTAQRSLEMQQVCEQLFAGEDFEIFKKMMIQRNVELELEVLKLIHKRQGKKSGSRKVDKGRSEAEILKEVMKRSEEEYKKEQEKAVNKNTTYNETMEKSIVQSVDHTSRLESEVLAKQEDTKRVVNESLKCDAASERRCGEKDSSQKHLENISVDDKSADTKEVSTEASSVPGKLISHESSSSEKDKSGQSTNNQTKKITRPLDEFKSEKEETAISSPSLVEESSSSAAKSVSRVVEKSPIVSPSKSSAEKKNFAKNKKPFIDKAKATSADAANSWMESARLENSFNNSMNSNYKNADSSSNDLNKRELYLKQQRDRLVNLKKDEREKQLMSYTKSLPKRPVSARVAKEAVSGENSGSMSADAQKQLAMRKVLAEKLKKQVIFKEDS